MEFSTPEELILTQANQYILTVRLEALRRSAGADKCEEQQVEDNLLGLLVQMRGHMMLDLCGDVWRCSH